MRVFFLLFLMACAEEKQEAPSLTITETETCGGTAPVIEELSCENTGLQFYPDAGVDLPTFTIRASITDEDADLTSYSMLIEFDTEQDNALAEDAQELTVTGSLGSNACSVSQGDIGASIYLQGGPPDFSTTYEWYVTIFDASGDRSQAEMIVCTTPDEEGLGEPY
jgi:hypothetical protein